MDDPPAYKVVDLVEDFEVEILTKDPGTDPGNANDKAWSELARHVEHWLQGYDGRN